MRSFIKRNILLYVRDKVAVFFALFAVLVLIALYVVFLNDLIAEGIPDLPDKNALLMTWFIAGIIAVTTMTTTLGAFGTFVEDRANQTILDFYVSPISKAKIVIGYICSALFVGGCMSFITFVIAYGYLLIFGNISLTLLQIFLMTGTIFLSVLTSASIVLFLVSFFHTSNAFAAASMVIGTLIGFLAGIYIPIGNFPEYLQTIIKLFPISHAASLFRQILMEETIISAFTNAPADVIDTFQYNMGIRYVFNGKTLANFMSIGYLVITTIVFTILSLLNMRRIQKKK